MSLNLLGGSTHMNVKNVCVAQNRINGYTCVQLSNSNFITTATSEIVATSNGSFINNFYCQFELNTEIHIA